MTKLSVIIPLYNGRSVIGPCLDSLVRERASVEMELVVIDDASPDGAGEFVREHYEEVVLLSNDHNEGYAASVNRGIETSGGEYLLLLNQDTELKENTIGTLLSCLQKDDSVVAAAPQLLSPDGSVQHSCRMLPRHSDIVWHHLLLSYIFPRSRTFSRWKMGWFDHRSEQMVEQPAFSAIMICRSVIDEVGPIDERFKIYFNDVDYCKRIHDSGGRILFCPAASVVHHHGQATKTIPFARIVHSHSGAVKYFFKHYGSLLYIIPNLIVTLLLLASGLVRLSMTAIRKVITSKGSSS